MCLIVKNICHLNLKPKVARRNIKCYKILSLYGDGTLRTCFRGQKIDSHDLVTGLCPDKFEKTPSNGVLNDHKVIIHGIHSYKNYKTAFQTGGISSIIVIAYIPKGSLYWIGKNKDYCSEKIEFN